MFCVSINILAQTTSYLDSDYNPTSSTDYIYKRVLKHKEQIINPNFGLGYYGNLTVNPQLTNLHICSVTDYYKSGELALFGNAITGSISCSPAYGFDGQVVGYYKNGVIKYRAPWSTGKLNGIVIYNDDEGNEVRKEEYVNGKLIEEKKYSAPSDSPITGVWKYEDYRTFKSVVDGENSKYLYKTSTYIYSSNGVVESIHQNRYEKQTLKGNWKYISKTPTTGVLEEFQGEDLIERGNVKFLSSVQIEYTITYSKNANVIGKKSLWSKQ